MQLIRSFKVLLIVALIVPAANAAQVRRRAPASGSTGIATRLKQLPGVVEKAVHEGKTPGAVVLVGHDGAVVYRRAIGYRQLVPRKLPMNMDTMFDMASCTKIVATTTAIMQLFEQDRKSTRLNSSHVEIS